MAGLRARSEAMFAGFMSALPGSPEYGAVAAESAVIRAEAKALFDFVAMPDWKAPIDCSVWVAESEVDDLAYAIEFYTATVPTIVKQPLGGYHVTADGYAAGPAGDH